MRKDDALRFPVDHLLHTSAQFIVMSTRCKSYLDRWLGIGSCRAASDQEQFGWQAANPARFKGLHQIGHDERALCAMEEHCFGEFAQLDQMQVQIFAPCCP